MNTFRTFSTYTVFSCHVIMTVPVIPCLSWLWYFRRTLNSYFVELFYIGFFGVLHYLKLCIFGKNITQVICSHCIISGGTWYYEDLLLVMLIPVTWLKWCLLCSSIDKFLIFQYYESYFETMQISCFSLIFHTLILTSISQSCHHSCVLVMLF